jgi:hypothetical protein
MTLFKENKQALREHHVADPGRAHDEETFCQACHVVVNLIITHDERIFVTDHPAINIRVRKILGSTRVGFNRKKESRKLTDWK